MLNKKQSILAVLSVLSILPYCAVQSAIIDFEEFATTVDPATSMSTSPGFGIETKGYNLTPGTWTTAPDYLDDMHIINAVPSSTSTDADGFYPYNETVVAGGHYDMYLERADGGEFSLYKFDFGGYVDSTGIAKESDFTVYGFFEDGSSSIWRDFSPDGDEGFETMYLGVEGEGWHGLSAVMFEHWGAGSDQGSFALDNIKVSTVPVPAAVWLFGSGLLGLAGVARRKV